MTIPIIRSPIEIPKNKPTILSTKKTPKKFKSVLLINHEPAVRNLVRSLTKNHNNNHFKLLNYKFPTSAFAKIYFDFNEWNKLDGNGLIKEFMRPKDLQDSKE